jgi:hypothetical protein
VRRKGRGRRPGVAGFAAAPGRAKQRGEEERKATGGEYDRWGRFVSETKEKKKRSRERGLQRGGGWWAAGLPGRKEGKVCFLFFFSLFKLFSKQLLNSNSNQTFSNFSQNFYNLFRNHTSNQKPCKAK